MLAMIGLCEACGHPTPKSILLKNGMVDPEFKEVCTSCLRRRLAKATKGRRKKRNVN